MFDAQSYFIQDHGLLKPEHVDSLLDELDMPDAFPQFVDCDHAACSAWTAINVMVEFDSSMISEQELASNLAHVMFERFSIDMMELLVNGDTQSDDPFLAQFDGLKKRTTWPDQIWVSRRVDVHCKEPLPGKLWYELTIYVDAS